MQVNKYFGETIASEPHLWIQEHNSGTSRWLHSSAWFGHQKQRWWNR